MVQASAGGGRNMGMIGAERIVELFMAEYIKCLAGDPLHKFSQRNEIDVGRSSKLLPGPLPGLLRRSFLDGSSRNTLTGAQVEVRETRRVCQQIENGDVFVSRAGKLREPTGDRVQQGDASFIQQFHDRRRGGDHFGQGSEIEAGYGLFEKGCVWQGIQPPSGSGAEDAVVIADHYDSAGDEIAGDGAFQEAVDRGGAGGIQQFVGSGCKRGDT